MAGWMAAVLVLAGATVEGATCSSELFRVHRNTNANVVVYEARRTPSGELDPDEPVHPSWLMLAEDGRREELNVVESAMAYGVDVHGEPAGSDREVSLRARPELVIRVSVERGCPVARVQIGGRDLRLLRVEVAASGGLFPGVDHVDVVGIQRPQGDLVRERIVPGT